MAHLYKTRQKVHRVQFNMIFDYVNDSGAGYSFECSEDGTIVMDNLGPQALANLELCKAGGTTEDPILPGKVVDTSWDYWEPGEGKCDRCKHVVYFDDAFLNPCDNCGADYDAHGSMLAPRSQWGEETGETLADILGPETNDY